MYFPLFLDTSKYNLLLVGGGDIAFVKLKTLSEFQFKSITILSKEISNQFRGIGNKINIIIDNYDEKYLRNIQIIIAATDDDSVNLKIAEDGRKREILVNVVDKKELCDFLFPAIVTRDKIVIGVSSSGTSPVLARWIKNKIEGILPNNLGILANFLDKSRDKIKSVFDDIQQRRIFVSKIIEKWFETGEITDEIEHSLSQNNGIVYFIGAGTGDAELLTIKAVRFLANADVVLHDKLVSEEVLKYARKDAKIVNVGKSRGCKKEIQDEINQMIVRYAKEGNIVARVKVGDVTIFGRLKDELEAISQEGIKYQIIPGITAASVCAAYSGISLTARDVTRGVRFLSFYLDDLEQDWSEIAKTKDSLVFYMSSKYINLICNKLIEFGMNSEMPIIVVENGGSEGEKFFDSSIGSFKKKYSNLEFNLPTLIIVGEVVDMYQKYKWRNGK